MWIPIQNSCLVSRLLELKGSDSRSTAAEISIQITDRVYNVLPTTFFLQLFTQFCAIYSPIKIIFIIVVVPFGKTCKYLELFILEA